MSKTKYINPGFWYSRRDRIIPRAKDELKYLINAMGICVTENDRKIKALKNIHKGERAFVIGNGPSLQINDLDKLKNEITFACNKIYLAFEETDWRPTYYFVSDELVAKNNKREIDDLQLKKFYGSLTYNLLEKNNNVICISESNRYHNNILRGMLGGATVLSLMIQIANYMGVKEIYLLGVDFNFNLSQKAGYKCNSGEVLISENEVNHFHSNYRKSGETWTYPNLDAQYDFFCKIRNILKKKERQEVIKNASRKTALDVFPLVNLEDII